MSTGYACAECGREAVVRSVGEIVRSCSHKGAVNCDMKSTAYAVGSFEHLHPVRAKLRRLVRTITEILGCRG